MENRGESPRRALEAPGGAALGARASPLGPRPVPKAVLLAAAAGPARGGPAGPCPEEPAGRVGPDAGNADHGEASRGSGGPDS
eukprot:10278001-Alexandrium_andersonii.AAC.1